MPTYTVSVFDSVSFGYIDKFVSRSNPQVEGGLLLVMVHSMGVLFWESTFVVALEYN